MISALNIKNMRIFFTLGIGLTFFTLFNVKVFSFDSEFKDKVIYYYSKLVEIDI